MSAKKKPSMFLSRSWSRQQPAFQIELKKTLFKCQAKINKVKQPASSPAHQSWHVPGVAALLWETPPAAVRRDGRAGRLEPRDSRDKNPMTFPADLIPALGNKTKRNTHKGISAQESTLGLNISLLGHILTLRMVPVLNPTVCLMRFRSSL